MASAMTVIYRFTVIIDRIICASVMKCNILPLHSPAQKALHVHSLQINVRLSGLSVRPRHIFAKTSIHKTVCQLPVYLISLLAYRRAERHKHLCRRRSFPHKHIESVVYDSAQSALPSGMNGSHSNYIRSIYKHRHTVSCEHTDRNIGLKSYKRVNIMISAPPVFNDSHIQRMCLFRRNREHTSKFVCYVAFVCYVTFIINQSRIDTHPLRLAFAKQVFRNYTKISHSNKFIKYSRVMAVPLYSFLGTPVKTYAGIGTPHRKDNVF